MLAQINSSAIVGLDAVPIEVEVDIASQGLPSFTIVGLPDKAVEEARERVRSALKNSGADFPAKRITVNLAPADLPKAGPSYDLPIAIGILIASGQLQGDFSDALFLGELSLDGKLRRVAGVLSQAILAPTIGIKRMFVPNENAKEASIITGVTVYPTQTLLKLFHHLSGISRIDPQPADVYTGDLDEEFDCDMNDIRGQEKAKRALEIAAAGAHNILMKGPPGAGKTMLARTLPTILPKLTLQEAIEVTKMYSIAGMLSDDGLILKRPFRSPHHTTSYVGLIGGGAYPKPGEISLAHRGVLFMDELPEFPRQVLETLRQPLEDRVVTISRAHGRLTFPTHFMLVAAQNPCPCGYLGDNSHQCSCTHTRIMQYKKRISGPLLDRIDLHLTLPAVKVEKLVKSSKDRSGDSSKSIKHRVQKARDRQTERFSGTNLTTNSEMTTRDLKTYVSLSDTCLELLKNAVSRMNLSARAYNRTVRVARTIADLDMRDEVMAVHIAEALQYRSYVDNL